jgi:hypothetical protein
VSNHFLVRSSVALLVVAGSLTAFGQNAQQSGAPKSKSTAQSFDPRDLSGVWTMSNTAMRPPALSNNRPPFTPVGQAKFATAKTGFGSEALGASGKQGIPPAQGGNDPILECNPAGFPRILYFGGAMRFVQTPTEMLQFFERNHIWRDLWTDGRKLPDDPEPWWYGHSVGRWDGDTFVVNSIAFDDRDWLDRYGSPHSAAMRTEERYRRADHDHLEMIITIDDPMTYTKPWVSDKKILNLAPANYDWREEFCVYSEEHSFQQRVMIPAGLGLQPK